MLGTIFRMDDSNAGMLVTAQRGAQSLHLRLSAWVDLDLFTINPHRFEENCDRKTLVAKKAELVPCARRCLALCIQGSGPGSELLPLDVEN